jgi:hypothetical protein
MTVTIKNEILENLQINLADLPEGLYKLSLSSEGKIET